MTDSTTEPTATADLGRRGALGLLAGAGAAGALLLHTTPAGATPPADDMPVFNVKDFGAVGDWNPSTQTGTDDRAAIQNARVACSGNNGGILYFPPGSYGASLGTSGTGNLIQTTDNMHIVFDPAAALHVKTTNLTKYRVINITNSDNVSVRGARIFGDAATNSSSGTNHRAISTGQSTNVNILWCEFHLIRGLQVMVGDTAPSSQTVIDGCLFNGALPSGSAEAGLYVSNSADLVVSNCTFGGATHGFRAGPTGGVTTVDTRVFACHFESNGTAANLNGATERVEVFANTFVDNTGEAVKTAAVDGSITANSIRGSGSHGISATAGTHTIVGNSVVGNGGYGISLGASDSLVVGNRTASNTSGTVNDTGSGNLVANNL